MLARVLTWWFKFLLWIEDEATVAMSLARADYAGVAGSGLHPCGHAFDDHVKEDEDCDGGWIIVAEAGDLLDDDDEA